jgi:hypothetical protein
MCSIKIKKKYFDANFCCIAFYLTFAGQQYQALFGMT